MTSVWRSLTQTSAAAAEAATAKKLLDGIQRALYEAFQRHAGDGREGHALTADEIAPIRELCDQLTPAHFQLQVPEPIEVSSKDTQSQHQRHGRNRVKYQHIWENELFSMGIFILPPGTSIPLHDHPDMSVISRVLYGRLHVTSCDLASPKEAGSLFHSTQNNSPVSSASTDSYKKRRLARIFKDVVITAPHTTALLPDQGNLHEFVADDEQGCAIFDILTPPYEPEEGRDCTYYRITSDVRTSEEGKKYVTLEEYEPRNFDVVSETYNGPRLTPPTA